MTRRAAYYGRNDSFSRSYNAEVAEDEGRLPRTRAAASLGLSAAAFDAGCAAAGYRPSEWHHVGKYANMVYYYDCEALAADPAFWAGAAAAYKSAKKRAEILATMDRRAEDERVAAVEIFRAKLIRQRDCTVAVRRHSALARWNDRCIAARISCAIPVGELATFAAAVAERRARDAATRARAELRERQAGALLAILQAEFAPATDDFGRTEFRRGDLVIYPQRSNGAMANVYRRFGACGRGRCETLPAAEVLEIIMRELKGKA